MKSIKKQIQGEELFVGIDLHKFQQQHCWKMGGPAEDITSI
jgi:hypothetical protein